MKTIQTKYGKEIKIFTDNIEQTAYDQIKALGDFEAYKDSKIRIMPDVHAGAGCTIGTTLTITDKITPNLVGVDIGCGMSVSNFDRNIPLNELDKYIKNNIPHGFNVRSEENKSFDFSDLKCKDHVDLVRANKSIGTLGGGNHFIELCNSDDGYYLVLHSGSRGIGNQVARYYQNLAIEKNKPKTQLEKSLAYLTGSDFDDYVNDIKIIQDYASYNRGKMITDIALEFDCKPLFLFETIHNYLDLDTMILRKGAVSAQDNETLIIPLNMRDGSLICIGKGNEDWNYSAPHGAGRVMSRSKAKQNIDLDEFKNQMKGIYSSSVGQSTLDEAPDAYKPMSDIIGNIEDTVDIIQHITPIYNFKSH